MLYQLSYVSDDLKQDQRLGSNHTSTKKPYCGLERVAGIEPASSAWKAEVLPLNYTRQDMPLYLVTASVAHASALLVEGVGFEPTKA